MEIRTISQLNSISQISDADLIEVSQKTVNGTTVGYVSKKATYSTLKTQVNKDVKDNMVEEFGLTDSSSKENIKVSDLKTQINEIKNGNIDFSGTKTFTSNPKITNSQITGDQYIATIGSVKTLIGSSTTNNIGTDSSYDACLTEDGYKNENDLLKTYINGGDYVSGEITCNHTGNLVLFGWLSDNSNVRANNAYVGLYGKIGSDWVLMQLHPWIIGTKSSILQYVGFSIPVKEGLKIKIITGFPVNGSANTNINVQNTLTYPTNQPNSFVGYILY